MAISLPPPLLLLLGNYTGTEELQPPDYGNYDDQGPQVPLDDSVGLLSGERQASLAAKICLGIVYAVTISVCTLCDTMLLVVVCSSRRKQVRTRLNLLLANLALSDLLVTSVSAPLHMDSYLRDTWRFGSTWCAAASYIKNVSLYVSTNSLVVISIHRALLTTRPHMTSSGVKSTVFIMVLIWITASVLVLPTAMFSISSPINDFAMPGEQQKIICYEHWPEEPVLTVRDYCALLIAFEFIVPVIIMVTCHTLIGCVIHRRPTAASRGANPPPFNGKR